MVTFSINQSDGVTAVSEELKRETLDYFDVKRDIKVIPNFIDFDRFSRSDKEHFKKALAPEGEKILIHTSNFRKVKRVEDAVLAFDQVRKKIPSKLLLVGDGPERASIEQLCREIGSCDDVRFLGKQDKVEELLAIADVFMMPSQSESFGLAALEAMACQVPVVSSNAGGIPEINIDGETGFLSDVGDVDNMAENVLKILKDEKTLESFRKKAYEQAKRFDIEFILPMYEEFYQEVMSQSAASVE